ncbi:hypothetical protein GCM10010232_26170 [Streptomyces amakusaensis]|uniref:VWA domain-containing protein n=1 Tax=Streptomyces amakusaensis TaxID=67271 RepID=A0ABW0AE39_9ACTN
MGIRSLLRKMFGRDRSEPSESAAASSVPPQSEHTEPATATAIAAATVPPPAETPAETPAEPAPAPSTTTTATVPTTATDLVSAAFDNPQARPQTAAVPPQSRTEPEPEPEPKAEPELKPEPDPEPEPEPEPAPIVTAEKAPEPVEETPAPAEPEPAPAPEVVVDEPAKAAEAPAALEDPVVATAEETPVPAEPEPEPEPEPEAEPESALPHHAAARDAVRRAGIKVKSGRSRTRVYLVLDRSGSMRPYYKDGSAQRLGEQTLALAAQFQDDPSVKVVFFSTEVDGTGELTAEAYEGRIDELHGSLGRMGRTNYHLAVDAVLALHVKAAPRAPALVVFQTDGAPESKTAATAALAAAATTAPKVFWQFVAFGEEDAKGFDYLRRLTAENAAFFHAGPTPGALADEALYDGILQAWRP